MTTEPVPPKAKPAEVKPATAEDLRGVRRWLLVAGVWAVAATAIAVIALVKASDATNDQENARTASQLTKVQRDLSKRLDDLDSRLEDLAPAEDVGKLDQRLKKVENVASRTTDRLEAVGKDVDDLQSQVDGLEQQMESNTDTTGTDTTETAP